MHRTPVTPQISVTRCAGASSFLSIGNSALLPECIGPYESLSFTFRHCEECNAEATQRVIQDGLGRFAALAMTLDVLVRLRSWLAQCSVRSLLLFK